MKENIERPKDYWLITDHPDYGYFKAQEWIENQPTEKLFYAHELSFIHEILMGYFGLEKATLINEHRSVLEMWS